MLLQNDCVMIDKGWRGKGWSVSGLLFQYLVAVELQPYGSKNLDGYRRAVVPPIHKTWDFADQNLSLTSTKCILHSTRFPA
jgi:hypothetical protein